MLQNNKEMAKKDTKKKMCFAFFRHCGCYTSFPSRSFSSLGLIWHVFIMSTQIHVFVESEPSCNLPYLCGAEIYNPAVTNDYICVTDKVLTGLPAISLKSCKKIPKEQ